MKFYFQHIDPRTGLPRMKEPRPEDDINLMSQRPGRSGWVKMLQNRVNLRSTGNIYQSKVVWYDRMSNSLCGGPDDVENGVYFQLFKLDNGQRPAGWIYVNGPRG